MPDNSLDIGIRVSGASEAAADVAKVGDALKGVGAAAEQAEGGGEKAAKGFQKFADNLKAFGSGALEGAFAPLDKFLGKEWKGDDFKKLGIGAAAAAFSSLGQLAREAWNEVAENDRATVALEKFGVAAEAAGENSGLIDDLEKFFGGNREQAADLFGQVMNGRTRVLKAYGIELGETSTREERLAAIQQLAARGVKANAAENETLTGSYNILKRGVVDLTATFIGAIAEGTGIVATIGGLNQLLGFSATETERLAAANREQAAAHEMAAIGARTAALALAEERSQAASLKSIVDGLNNSFKELEARQDAQRARAEQEGQKKDAAAALRFTERELEIDEAEATGKMTEEEAKEARRGLAKERKADSADRKLTGAALEQGNLNRDRLDTDKEIKHAEELRAIQAANPAPREAQSIVDLYKQQVDDTDKKLSEAQTGIRDYYEREQAKDKINAERTAAEGKLREAEARLAKVADAHQKELAETDSALERLKTRREALSAQIKAAEAKVAVAESEAQRSTIENKINDTKVSIAARRKKEQEDKAAAEKRSREEETAARDAERAERDKERAAAKETGGDKEQEAESKRRAGLSRPERLAEDRQRRIRANREREDARVAKANQSPLDAYKADNAAMERAAAAGETLGEKFESFVTRMEAVFSSLGGRIDAASSTAAKAAAKADQAKRTAGQGGG